MDAVFAVPEPRNEAVRDYAPGSPERASLERKLAELAGQQWELPMTIDGQHRMGGGDEVKVVKPHRHRDVLGVARTATNADVEAAVNAALKAGPMWRAMSFADRASVFLKAADLLSGPWRDTLNAATMLGQSKSVYQAEIDAAAELTDFFRFNVAFAQQLMSEQPRSSAGVWNRLDHRPLEGFVVAVTPFNFTSIAGNLPTSPALMGVPVVWKPSSTAQFAAHFIMRLLEEAGLPAGVINMVTGRGTGINDVALVHPDFAGLHFTGSTATFHSLWARIAGNLPNYHSYPRIVGETGGKDFVIAHPSADEDAVLTGLIRGAFEYQGQKCSAASRAYIPRSMWERGLRDRLAATTDSLTFGDITDFSNFCGAVIDRRAFDKLSGVIDRVAKCDECTIIAGGTTDDSEGYFIRPTVIEGVDPTDEIFTTEYFGPILGVHVYDDAKFTDAVTQAEAVAPYALTGAVFARDRKAIEWAAEKLRYAAGNFYINDKPTGAVVGQQPFGGARASGTNDKAGSVLNLMRWVSPRAIKETFVPPTDHRYPHMG